METHDVAIPRDIPAWTDADTVFLHTASGFNMMEDLLKLQYNRLQTELDKSQLDFSRIARAERMYKSLWDHVYHNFYKTQDSENTKTVRERELALFELAKTHVEVDFYLKLEKSIYPFLHLHPRQTSFSLYESYTKSSRGIVVCAGNGQFEFIVSSIQAIRLLNPTVPIEVFYMGDGDLSTLRQNYIRDMTSNIEVKDVTKILDNKEMILGGWSIKAFSMLASSFQEVILIDSDAYFLRDPAQLFSDPGYVATGALFFYDRTLWNDWRVGPDFLRSIMPTMSSFPKTTRWFRGLSAHEQESGVVVINKRTRFQGLLAVCKMNMKWERDLHSYKVFYGDKETFWTGFEMVQEPYSFMKTFSGVIGERREGHEESDAICGAQLHLNHLNEPTWWNGGLMRNKNSGVRRPLKFEFWKAGGGLQKHRERNVRNEVLMNRQLFELGLESKEQLDAGQKAEAEDPVWIFEESCLTGGEVRELSQEDKKLTSAYGRIDVIGKQDEARIKAGEAVDPKVSLTINTPQMNTFIASPGFDASRFQGTTLILPSVSIGNVPQLATDLFLAALSLDRVGSIEDENVVPVLGPADSPLDITKSLSSTQTHSTAGLSLAVEVFQSKDGKWTLIQQRSPTIAHRSGHYVENLVKFIQDSQFDQVVLLTSADGARRTDQQLRSGHPVRFVGSTSSSSSSSSSNGSELQNFVEHQLGIQPLERIPATEQEALKEQEQKTTLGLVERVQDIQLESSTLTSTSTSEGARALERVPRIPSGGIARRLHGLCQENGINILTLVAFAMEGDNAEDAIFLANVLNAALKLYNPTEEQIQQGEGGWKVPKSWDSLYGNSYPQDMYQ
ncbi:hypothetical protein BG004_001485 [Podila humilis]|nr:hypothetical protein BG004_001485 [Podila humilis]